MNEAFSRSALLWGEEGNARLAAAHVAVFGLGGVGGHAVEALARAGVGALTLVDSDTVCESNLNRQILATTASLGMQKAEAARERVLAINPACRVTALPLFYLPENADTLPLAPFSYVLDCIDTVSAKIELIVRAGAAGVPIVSAMGCGNKLDPTRFCVADIYETSADPLARVMRRELRKRGVDKLCVVYSTEPARVPRAPSESAAPARQKQTPGSMSFVPGVAGMIMAGVASRAIAGA